MKLTALIVDDEERARISLKGLLREYCGEIEVVAEAANVPDAVLAINKYNPQVVFLDIEMPEYNGFRLFEFFKKVDFKVVFVTAYSEFAIRAFEVGAVDYILKPVEIDALVRTVSRLKETLDKPSAIQEQMEVVQEVMSNQIHKIAIPTSDGLIMVQTADIVALEADGAYTNIHVLSGKRMMVSKKLIFFENVLSTHPDFFRAHRSHMINLRFLSKYVKGDNLLVLDNNMSFPISRDKKQELEDKLKGIQVGK